LFSQHDLNARQERWFSFLREFDFEVGNIKGREKKIADALSRRTTELYKVIISKTKNYIEETIKSSSRNDVKYIKTTDQLQKNEGNIHSIDLNIDKNGLLVFKNMLYVPNDTEFKMMILNELHKNPYSGHPRYPKMITTKKIVLPAQYEI